MVPTAALSKLSGMVHQQATLMSFMDVFYLLTMLFASLAVFADADAQAAGHGRWRRRSLRRLPAGLEQHSQRIGRQRRESAIGAARRRICRAERATQAMSSGEKCGLAISARGICPWPAFRLRRPPRSDHQRGEFMTTDIAATAEMQAALLSRALPYMQRYENKTVVVKYGGHAMGDPALGQAFARDIALLKQSGVNPIVVHGGGPQIGAMLAKMGIESKFEGGLRVTDQKTVEIVEMVLAGSINKEIVALINAEGEWAIGLCGKDGNMVFAEKAKKTVERSRTPTSSACSISASSASRSRSTARCSTCSPAPR